MCIFFETTCICFRGQRIVIRPGSAHAGWGQPKWSAQAAQIGWWWKPSLSPCLPALLLLFQLPGLEKEKRVRREEKMWRRVLSYNTGGMGGADMGGAAFGMSPQASGNLGLALDKAIRNWGICTYTALLVIKFLSFCLGVLLVTWRFECFCNRWSSKRQCLL